jgi:hypothetical protein
MNSYVFANKLVGDLHTTKVQTWLSAKVWIC